MSVHSNVGPSGQFVEYAQANGITHELLQDQFLWCLIQRNVQNIFFFFFVLSPQSRSFAFIAPSSINPFMLCCSQLWLASTSRQEPKRAIQLSEAVVGGRLPRRLAQQTVCGVVHQFAVPGNSCELRVQRDAVAVKTVGASSVRETREERRPMGAHWTVEGERAGRAPRRAMKAWVPTVGSLFCLQHWEEREVCQRRQWREAPQSVRTRGGEGSAGQRGVGWGGGGLAVERKSKCIERCFLAGECGDGERVKGSRRGEREETLHATGRCPWGPCWKMDITDSKTKNSLGESG